MELYRALAVFGILICPLAVSQGVHLRSQIFSGYMCIVCARTHMCFCGDHVHVHTCLWRPEVKVGCHSRELSISFFEIEPLIGLELAKYSRLASQ